MKRPYINIPSNWAPSICCSHPFDECPSEIEVAEPYWEEARSDPQKFLVSVYVGKEIGEDGDTRYVLRPEKLNTQSAGFDRTSRLSGEDWSPFRIRLLEADPDEMILMRVVWQKITSPKIRGKSWMLKWEDGRFEAHYAGQEEGVTCGLLHEAIDEHDLSYYDNGAPKEFIISWAARIAEQMIFNQCEFEV